MLSGRCKNLFKIKRAPSHTMVDEFSPIQVHHAVKADTNHYFVFGHRQHIIETFKDLRVTGHRALFIPEIIDLRLFSLSSQSSHALFEPWTVPSIFAMGKDKNGKELVIYHHASSILCSEAYLEPLVEPDPQETREIISKLEYGKFPLPQREFDRMADLHDGITTTVMTLAEYTSLPSGAIPIQQAAKHPGIIARLGGQKRANEYISALVNATKNLGFNQFEAPSHEPWGGLMGIEGLDDLYHQRTCELYEYGNFLCIPNTMNRSPSGGFPTPNQIYTAIENLVAPVLKQELKERAENLCK
jgi:hypothetical protein